MKIFPLHLMSHLDIANNLLNIMTKYKSTKIKPNTFSDNIKYCPKEGLGQNINILK